VAFTIVSGVSGVAVLEQREIKGNGHGG